MAALKHAFLALAQLCLVVGLISTCPDLSYTITTQADIDTITNCAVVRGDLTFDSASGSIYLPYPTQIGGNVYVRNNSQLQSLTFDAQFLGGYLVVQNATALTTLLTMSLNTVEAVVLQNVPLLNSWGEPNSTVLYGLTVENTLLVTIGLPHVETMDEVYIKNNRNLTDINIRALKNVTNYFTVQANEPDLSVRLDELQLANNISWRDIGDAEIPKLDKVNDTLEISDSSVQTVNLPKLAYAGTLSFQNNVNLTYIGAPDLDYVDQGITIVNNSKLASPGNFTSLEKTNGITLSGDFTDTSFDSFPALTRVRDVDATSTGDVPFNCTYFQAYRDEGVIYNYYTCNGTVSPSLSPPGGSLSTGARAGIGVGAGLGGIIVIGCAVAAMIYCYRRSHRKPAQARGTGTTVNGGTGVAEEKTPAAEVEGLDIPGEGSLPELRGRGADVVGHHPEMEGERARATELDGGQRPFSTPVSAELDSRTFPVEMPP